MADPVYRDIDELWQRIEQLEEENHRLRDRVETLEALKSNTALRHGRRHNTNKESDTVERHELRKQYNAYVESPVGEGDEYQDKVVAKIEETGLIVFVRDAWVETSVGQYSRDDELTVLFEHEGDIHENSGQVTVVADEY